VLKVKENLKRVINYLTGLIIIAILLVSNVNVSAQNAAKPGVPKTTNTDSIAKVNRAKADSLSFLRGYKESKHYRDSVEFTRQNHFANQKAERDRILDSTRNSQKRIADSIMKARTRYSDSIRNHNDSVKLARVRIAEEQRVARERRADSLDKWDRYKNSKHYKDSVETAKETRLAAVTKARKHILDSTKTVQRHYNDSLFNIRKSYSDSMKSSMAAQKTVRLHNLDSMKTVRAARTDSLNKAKLARADLRKRAATEKEKKKEEKLKLKLEIKIKAKQAKYNNQDMRKKKWTVPRQIIQNTFTRYNYFFNANKRMNEATANMVRSHVNNYDSLISLFPFNPDLDSSKLKTDMDTIIRKTALGIQIHDPRAKWQDDLYLLMGEAFYYKGDYVNAGAAFKTIVSETEKDKKEAAKKKGAVKVDKTKPVSFSEPDKTGIAGMLEHHVAENEALLWLSRVFAQSKKEGQAQTVLDLVRNDANFPERLRGRLALEQAFIDLTRQDYPKVVTSLNIVATDKELPKYIRLRAAFLNGQLLQRQLHYIESDQYFNIALSLNPNLEMEFYAKKNIALNSINNGTSTLTADNLLDKMSKDDKFKPYFDQIYYSMGKAALKNKQSDLALEDFKKSVKASKSNHKQKGLSFAALGDEYYGRSDYSNAKSAYDTASMLLTVAEDPEYSLAKKRAQALDMLAVPGNIVKTEDSLIRMAALPEKDQRKIIHDYVKNLERHMRDSIALAQNSGNQNNNASVFNNNANAPITWYFANPNLMTQGQNDFKQKWGGRALKDNWRISSSTSGIGNNNATEEDEPAQDPDALNLPNEDTLYAAIPHTPKDLERANALLAQGYFDLGKAYYNSLEDYDKSIGTFDLLNTKYPDSKNNAEVIYTRYLIAMRKNDPSKAAAYNKELQQKYPTSQWAKLLSGENQDTEENTFLSPGKTDNKETLSNFYDETYAQLMQRQYNDVLIRIKDADASYKNQGTFRKKFTLMKAVAIAGNGGYPEADTMLRQFVSANPNDSLVAWANTILAYIKQQPGYDSLLTKKTSELQLSTTKDSTGKVIPAKDSTGKTIVAPKNLQSTDTTTSGPSALNYLYHPNTVHYVIISAPSSAKLSGLRSGLSDYNLMKEGKGNIAVTMSTLDATHSLIVCKEFATAADAKKYMSEIRNVNILFREFTPAEYDILLISAENFPKLFVKKDIGFYKAFYSKNYK
jgi:tetratricopeptide (TPR) repeat protein